MPPKFSIYDVFPFTMLVKPLSGTGKELDGQNAARYRARSNLMNHNVPLEILFYLVSGLGGFAIWRELIGCVVFLHIGIDHAQDYRNTRGKCVALSLSRVRVFEINLEISQTSSLTRLTSLPTRYLASSVF
jgi:hypothetical protein